MSVPTSPGGAGPRRVAVVPDTPEPAPTSATTRPRASRAGRNLPAAVAVGTGLGALVALALFVRKEAFVVLTAAAIVLALWELANAFRARRIRIPVVPVVVGAVGMLASAFLAGAEALFVSFALTAFAVLLWRVLDGPNPVRDVTAGVFTAAYVPFLAGFAMLMLAAPDGAYRVLAFLMVAIGSDVGGYAFGSVWGKHPLAPNVSPKKSWEGLLGSAVFAVVLGVLGVVLGLGGPWWVGALLGLVVVVTATVGDLSESLLKRDLGIKDMGSLLPGHGGIMDRLDSLLPAAPVAYVLLTLLVPLP
ncbi:phosphatidate cytidylyltransferase [Aquipuribacter nitratireducens]|uniref:Phosphatidate cytidylyltransferase n=1 Tax=Aquipuribacter nitratireducens TaxID=650104 RepID=A0ABW0GL02_9MICO